MKTDIHATKDVMAKTDLDSEGPSELTYLGSKTFNY